MFDSWYSRQYLGKAFNRFLESKMKLKDFTLLQSELLSVSVQLQELNNFIESGSRNKIGGIRTKASVEKEN